MSLFCATVERIKIWYSLIIILRHVVNVFVLFLGRNMFDTVQIWKINHCTVSCDISNFSAQCAMRREIGNITTNCIDFLKVRFGIRTFPACFARFLPTCIVVGGWPWCDWGCVIILANEKRIFK